ncbi:unnamed protein product [Ilex paraguariensis]|uniref:Uncharacterized protein n=1 Tax=Ilex paraguariensis TaxID=185542 RepID=A0ABC8R224_9AQUA
MSDKDNGSLKNAIEIFSSSDKVGTVTDIDVDECSPRSEPEETPLRPIFCLKKKVQMKEFEEIEDCFILEFDPDDDDDDSINLSKLSMSKNLGNKASPELSVIAEKGQVACRDYPHSRHVCLNYPIEKTPHERHCELCYCFVCDTTAPCKNWTGQSGHCHAKATEAWKFQRNLMRQKQKISN